MMNPDIYSTISNSSIVESRSLLVLHWLKRKLDDVIPKNQEILRYREQIVNEAACSKLTELLRLEYELSEEHSALSCQIQDVENDWRKKVMAIAMSRLKVVEKKRKQIAKELNRLIMDSDLVKRNMHKITEELDYIKLHIEMRHTHSLTADVHAQTLETTTIIQRKDFIMQHEGTLLRDIAELKRQTAQQEHVSRELDELNMKVNEAKSILDRYQAGDDPKFKTLFQDLFTERDSQNRICRQKLEAARQRLDNYKIQLGRENESHRQTMLFLQNRLESCNSKDLVSTSIRVAEIQNLESTICDLKNHREDTTREVLKIRMRWHRYECEEKEKKMTNRHDDETKECQERKVDAANFLQRRLLLLHKTKLKKISKVAGH